SWGYCIAPHPVGFLLALKLDSNSTITTDARAPNNHFSRYVSNGCFKLLIALFSRSISFLVWRAKAIADVCSAPVLICPSESNWWFTCSSDLFLRKFLVNALSVTPVRFTLSVESTALF